MPLVWRTVGQTASPSSPSSSYPSSLGDVYSWLHSGARQNNRWTSCHSAVAFVLFLCPHYTNTSLPPPTFSEAPNCPWHILTLQLTQAWASWDSFWYPAKKPGDTFTLMFRVCVCARLYLYTQCTCCIQFQSILDSITQTIKDHLFQCANLIRPRTDLKVFLSVSHSIEPPPPPHGKSLAELLTEHPWHTMWQFHAHPLIQLPRLSVLL